MIGLFSLLGMFLVGLGLDAASSNEGDDGGSTDRARADDEAPPTADAGPETAIRGLEDAIVARDGGADADDMGDRTMLETFLSEFRADTGLFGSDGLKSLFGADDAGAETDVAAVPDAPETEADVASSGTDGVLAAAGATADGPDADGSLPLIDGYDPAADQLVLGYDPAVNPAPEVEISSDPGTGAPASIIHLDGVPVARVVLGGAASAFGVDDIALVPIAAIEAAC